MNIANKINDALDALEKERKIEDCCMLVNLEVELGGLPLRIAIMTFVLFIFIIQTGI